jgi:hypothetical protein
LTVEKNGSFAPITVISTPADELGPSSPGVVVPPPWDVHPTRKSDPARNPPVNTPNRLRRMLKLLGFIVDLHCSN